MAVSPHYYDPTDKRRRFEGTLEKLMHKIGMFDRESACTVKDATAGAMLPEGDGYLAAIINFRYIANAVWTTDQAVKAMGG